jgi:hypothetical protein
VSKLAAVPDVPFCCCPPWALRHLDDRPTHGSMCFICARDVAAPEIARGKRVACIYCGLSMSRRRGAPAKQREAEAARGKGNERETQQTTASALAKTAGLC